MTEPTLSGLHDLQRVSDLTNYFDVKACVCINKWDVNESLTIEIETQARQRGMPVVGKVRYDRAVTMAQVHGQAVTECQCDAADDIRRLWGKMKEMGEEYGIRL